MWAFKNSFIFVYVSCLTFAGGVKDRCDHIHTIPKWERNTSTAPGFLRQDSARTTPNVLIAMVTNRRENMTLNLYANPFVKDGNCSFPADNYQNLRKFAKSYSVIKGDDENEMFLYTKIFTGCYFFEMINSKDERWLWPPRFYNKSYPYYDTMVKCNSRTFKAEQNNRQLIFELEVPLTCLRLNCNLYELDSVDNNTESNLDNGSIKPNRVCWVIYNGMQEYPEIRCRDSSISLRLVSERRVKSNGHQGWTTVIKWNTLKKNGGYYYSLFQLYNHTCKLNLDDLETWQPVVVVGGIIHGCNNKTKDLNVSTTMADDVFHNPMFGIMLYTVLSVIVMGMLVYCMWKYVKIQIARKREAMNLHIKPQDILQAYDKKESNRIVLIYARDSTEFMKLMESIRNTLEKSSHFAVHDLYSKADWHMLATLGASKWLEQLLRNGCKVVWIDTPQFRSLLNTNKCEQNLEQNYADFRDAAIPYAVALATELFQNAATQYRCHFVVRLKGFEVDNGQEDPLLVVSPHARYCYPEHFSLLCKHLTR